jgi:chemotaxis protein MotB
MMLSAEVVDESPMLAVADLMIAILFLLLIILPTLSLTYREDEQTTPKIILSADGLIEKVTEYKDKVQQLQHDLNTIQQRYQQQSNELKKSRQLQDDLDEVQRRYQQQNDELQNVQKIKRQLEYSLASVKNTRVIPLEVLMAIQNRMEQEALPVDIDIQNAVIRLSDAILFASASAVLSKKGKETLKKLAFIFNDVLPCFTHSLTSVKKKGCEKNNAEYQLDAIFLEGHADNIPLKSRYQDNWSLSMLRAKSTYNALIKYQPQLKKLTNRSEQSLFSLSAYGDTRPISDNETPEGRRKNRRIDLRFISFSYELIK